MKAIKWINPNRMRFESPHKAFNRQCRLISTGNQIGDVVYSNYVRPYTEIHCNSFTRPPGHLQEYDLTLNLVGRVPGYIADGVREKGRDNTLILYQIHHWSRERQIVDGWILTMGHNDSYKLVKVWYINRDWRAMGAVDEVVKYISN